MQVGLSAFHQNFRQTFWLFIQAGANVECFRFEQHRSGLVENAAGKIKPNALQSDEPNFNGKQVVVTGRRFVAQVRFDHGKNRAIILPLGKWNSQ